MLILSYVGARYVASLLGFSASRLLGFSASRLLGFSAILIFTLGTFILGFRGRNAAPPPIGPPRVPQPTTGFEPAEVQLGPQFWGMSVSLGFRFANGGVEPIRIQSLGASCGCVMVNASEYVGQLISPGESVAIAGVLETGHHPGLLTRVFDLVTDRGARYEARVHVEVLATWSLSADAIDFGTVVIGSNDEPASPKRVTFSSAVDVLVAEPLSGAEWLHCACEDLSAGVTVIEASLRPAELRPGIRTTSITLETSNLIRPTGVIHVRVRAVTRLTLVPERIALGDSGSKCVRAVDAAGQPVRIAHVVPSSPRVTARLLDNGTAIEVVRTGEGPLEAETSIRVEDEFGNVAVLAIGIL